MMIVDDDFHDDEDHDDHGHHYDNGDHDDMFNLLHISKCMVIMDINSIWLLIMFSFTFTHRTTILSHQSSTQNVYQPQFINN